MTGRAYAIVLDGRRGNADAVGRTSSPTRTFGTIVTASGSAHTWSGNSRENRLTPFANDPDQRSDGRGDLRARRRDRRVVVADARARCRAPADAAAASSATRPA